MDKNAKFFRKLSPKQQDLLNTIIARLVSGTQQGLVIKKLTGSDYFRLRKGPFRIIFHYEDNEVVIDTVRLKNEATYKDF